ncbi:MAG TPA: tetratricopeptide repeat protein [Terriglobales bacterium]|jgi:tetratricopeptide (TPR) repeat protein|nr:tetratricopeptide repeat protein [Terriglobales bacterium]
MSRTLGGGRPNQSAWCFRGFRFLTCTVVALSSTSFVGQATRGSATKQLNSLFHSPVPSVPDDRVKGPDGAPFAPATGDESCFMWPLTGVRPPTSGVTSLEVPGQARKDFQRACGAARDKKLASAEQHLRKALQEEEKYPAALVLLGQVLKAQQRPEDAREACSQALRVDPNYLPADLCLADLFALQQRWEEMLHFSQAAVALDPANDPHAYFYSAGAYFGLHRLPEAERSALKAAEIDKAKREPRTHFLLAQIYEVERKPDAEADQLREYLKSATDPEEVSMVKKYLDDLGETPRK